MESTAEEKSFDLRDSFRMRIPSRTRITVTEVRGKEFQNGNCWYTPGSFRMSGKYQGLQDTENERVRKSAKKKELQTRTLQHKAKILYEWQRKDLEEECEGA